MKKFDCRDHHTRLARHQREVLKMDKSQFPEDGMLCPICSHVCRTPEDQRFVDSCLLFLFYFIYTKNSSIKSYLIFLKKIIICCHEYF